MKICPNPHCKTENPDRANYCLNCGASLNQSLVLALPDAKHCIECGRPVKRFRSDRRNITVLFADVHGFTAMSEKLDPEEVTEIMNECFTMLTAKIIEVGGSIDKYSGDNIMALFGAPEAHEDDPERAVRAALNMQKELVRFNSLMTAKRGLNLGLEMRIGLNSGLVTAGDVGGNVIETIVDDMGSEIKISHDYRSYTVMGTTVNLASRLEHEARVGHVLVSPDTFEATRHAFDFVQMDPRPIKGITGLVAPWEVIGPKAQRENRRGLAGYDLQLIGRDTELAALWEKLQATLQNKGQVVSVIAEAGAGKSSLLREFKRRLNSAEPDVTYLSGACFSYSADQPYSLMSNTIRRLCHVNDDDDDETVRQKLVTTIGTLMGENPIDSDGNYTELAALIGLAVGLYLPNELIDNLEPPLRSRLAADAISDFLLKKADAHPLVLVLDDLHWIDTNSLQVVDRLVQKVLLGGKDQKPLPVLLGLVYRPDFTHEWPVGSTSGAACYSEIRLSRLTSEQIEALSKQLLAKLANIEYTPEEAEQPLPLPLVKELSRADGNPFFTEEILKSLWDSKQLHFVEADKELDELGGWRVTDEAETFRLPGTLQEILLARIDALPGTSKRVLQIGAVIGQRFEHRVLLSVEDLQPRPKLVSDALDELHQESFIYTERSEPDAEYAFRQALTQEVAYQNLLSAERKVYHEQIAQAIERIYSSHLEDYDVLNALARHYQNTDNHQKAIYYLTRAGHNLKNLYQNDAALRNYYEAKARLNLLPNSPEKSNLAVEINRSIGEVLALRAEYSQALEAYREALQQCTVPAERIDLWGRVVEVQTNLGEFEELIASYDQAQAEYANYNATIKDDEYFKQMYARLLTRFGWGRYRQSNYESAITAFIEGLELLESLSNQSREVQVDTGILYGHLGSIYLDMGQVAEADAYFQKAVDTQEKINNLAKVARAYINLALIYTIQGNWRKAEQYYKLAKTNAERIGDVEAVTFCIGNLGNIYERQGRLGAALRSYSEAAKSFAAASNPLQLTVAQLSSANILIQQAKIDQALELLDTAIKTSISLNVDVLLGYGYSYLGLARMAVGQFVEARDWLQKGYQKAKESGSPDVVATSCLNLVEFLLSLDSTDTAMVYLDEAEPLAEQMGDPMNQARIERLRGRLALSNSDFANAIAQLQLSLQTFDSLKAYLEMSYTKFYLAKALLEQDACTDSNQNFERSQLLLQQAVETFKACEANQILPEAIALLEKYLPVRAA